MNVNRRAFLAASPPALLARPDCSSGGPPRRAVRAYLRAWARYESAREVTDRLIEAGARGADSARAEDREELRANDLAAAGRALAEALGSSPGEPAAVVVDGTLYVLTGDADCRVEPTPGVRCPAVLAFDLAEVRGL